MRSIQILLFYTNTPHSISPFLHFSISPFPTDDLSLYDCSTLLPDSIRPLPPAISSPCHQQQDQTKDCCCLKPMMTQAVRVPDDHWLEKGIASDFGKSPAGFRALPGIICPAASDTLN